MRVLITGGGGRLGTVLARELGDTHELILGDVRPIDDPRYVPLNVRDVPRVREVVADCDAVIHLAIMDSLGIGPTGSLEYAQAAFDVHVTGTYNVLRAAFDAGAKRVLCASSVSAVAGYPEGEMIGSNHRPKGGGIYGVTKGLGEELCRHFHEECGLPVVVLRLGNVYFEGLNWDHNQYPEPSRVDSVDVARAFAAVLQAPRPAFALIHIVGDNIGSHYDLEAARKLYGWKPQRPFGTDGKPVD